MRLRFAYALPTCEKYLSSFYSLLGRRHHHHRHRRRRLDQQHNTHEMNNLMLTTHISYWWELRLSVDFNFVCILDSLGRCVPFCSTYFIFLWCFTYKHFFFLPLPLPPSLIVSRFLSTSLFQFFSLLIVIHSLQVVTVIFSVCPHCISTLYGRRHRKRQQWIVLRCIGIVDAFRMMFHHESMLRACSVTGTCVGAKSMIQMWHRQRAIINNHCAIHSVYVLELFRRIHKFTRELFIIVRCRRRIVSELVLMRVTQASTTQWQFIVKKHTP